MAAPPATPPTLGLELASPPTDGVTSLRFSGDSGLLLATSWDAGVRLYEADPGSQTSALRQHFVVRCGGAWAEPGRHEGVSDVSRFGSRVQSWDAGIRVL